MSFWSRLANVIRGKRLIREIDEEFESHFEEAIQQGLDPDDARKAFGSVLRRREESRDARSIVWLDSLRADAVFGWRQLMKRKVTSAAAIISLALAIGACTSAFRLIDALLLRPLPIAGPERLYALSREGFVLYGKPSNYDGWEYPAFQRMRDAVADRAELIAISYAEQVEITYRADEEIEKAHVQYVSGGMFGSFGIGPACGRLLAPNDDRKPGAHPVAVLSYDYWSRRFGRDPKVIGQSFRLGKGLYEIVGVANAPFTGTEPGTVIDIFMPTMMHWGITQPGWTLFRTFVHLRPGFEPGAVRERLAATVRAINEEKAKLHAEALGQTLVMEPAAAGVSGLQKDYRLSLTSISVLVGLVLLIACANVANLMAAQASARTREMALRVSIGAGRARLVQMVLVESAWLAFFAAVTGAWFAWWSAPFILGRINPPDNPARLALPADWRVLVFSLLLTLGVTLLLGLMPALRASAVKPVHALKGGEDPHLKGRWMHGLIAVQAAFCFLVLFSAGLFVATLNRLSHQPLGFSADRLVIVNTVTKQHEPTARFEQVAAQLRKLPGVEQVAYADWPLLDGYSFKSNAISIDGAAPTGDSAWFMNVSPGWIETMRIPLVDGRDFRASDTSPGAAIVNETFARQYFNGANPIGKWFAGTSSWMSGQRFQIVGLVRDTRYRYLRQPVLPVAYTPFNRMSDMGKILGGTFIVRTAGPNPLGLASLLRREVSRARFEFRVSTIRTQSELNDLQTIRERLLARLALFFAGVALLLAAVGLYGVLEYSVQQRRHEMGIRLALGARAGDVARRITVNVFSMVLAGAAAGVTLGMAGVRYIDTLLYGVKATEMSVLAIPALMMIAASILAALPAVIHAIKIDPVTLLRTE